MVTKRQQKAFKKGAFLALILIGSLFLNVFLHEAGHWLVANELGLDPQMKLFDDGTGKGVSFVNPEFYVIYSSSAPGISMQDFYIALAGPLVNLIIAGFAAIAYVMTPSKQLYKRAIFLMLLIPSVISAASNLIPTGGTDGALLAQFLR